MTPESGTADLYGLPLDEFTEERDRLARRLRDNGRQKEAEVVAKMRKPTTDAWALNQVARRHSKQIEWLMQSQRALREAGDAEAFRDASASRRRLVDDIMDAAVAVLEEAGHSSSGPVRERIARTLLAAATDPETERALREGTLDRPVEISAAWPETVIQTRPAIAEDDPEWLDEVTRLEAEAQEMTERAEHLRRLAKQTRHALDEARRRSEEAERAARAAEKAAKTARERAQAAHRRGH